MTNNEIENSSIYIKPVGYIKNEIQNKRSRSYSEVDSEIKKQENKTYHDAVKKIISELVIYPEYIELLDGVDEFSHITSIVGRAP